jgi:hypothetical protein
LLNGLHRAPQRFTQPAVGRAILGGDPRIFNRSPPSSLVPRILLELPIITSLLVCAKTPPCLRVLLPPQELPFPTCFGALSSAQIWCSSCSPRLGILDISFWPPQRGATRDSSHRMRIEFRKVQFYIGRVGAISPVKFMANCFSCDFDRFLSRRWFFYATNSTTNTNWNHKSRELPMPFKSETYRVLIASPSDLAEERQAATEAVTSGTLCTLSPRRLYFCPLSGKPMLCLSRVSDRKKRSIANLSADATC